MADTSNAKAFCEHCRHMVDVTLANAKESMELDDVRYVYPVRYGTCKECGGRATPEEVLRTNQESFLNAVREGNGIVSQEIIDRVPEKYNIGKRPLSKLLGWGEQSYSRFIAGDIPSKEYSNLIERIDRSPLAFLVKLYSNAEVLTNVAFNKSKGAAIGALVESGSAVDRAAAFILAKTGSASPLALQKELYYTNGLAIAFSDRPLFTNRCEAWTRGPVFPEIWEDLQLRDAREESLFGLEVADAVTATFSTDELRVLNAVVSRVACYSPYVLQEFTHHEDPWLTARENIPEGQPSQREISLDSIGSFFSKIRAQFEMKAPEDIERYMSYMLDEWVTKKSS